MIPPTSLSFVLVTVCLPDSVLADIHFRGDPLELWLGVRCNNLGRVARLFPLLRGGLVRMI